jgi:hypothetical protein
MRINRVFTGLRDESGMTLLELLIASLILFFAIAAVMSLIIVSTSMSVFAKQRNLVNNAAASYTEYVRQLPYTAVGVQGTSVPGSLTAETTTSVGGFQVSVRPAVSWVNDPLISGTKDYKKLVIVVRASPPEDGRVVEQTFTTYVRRNDPLQAVGFAAGQRTPLVNFVDAGTPAADQVVWGSSTRVTCAAQVRADGAALTNVSMFVDAADLTGSNISPTPQTFGVAKWINIAAESGTFFCDWDTTARDALGNLIAPDGFRTLKALAQDNIGGTSYKVRRVIVDNSAPATPTNVAASVVSSNTTNLSWEPALDGTDWADHYILYLRQDTGGEANWDQWTNRGSASYTTYSLALPTAGFSRYWVGVKAVSPLPRQLESPTGTISPPFISRPSVSGTASVVWSGSTNNGYYTTKNTVWLTTPPTFPDVAASRHWYLYRADSSAGPWTTEVANGVTTSMAYTDTLTTATGKKSQTNPVGPAHYYKLKFVIQPMYNGYGATAPLETVWSNVIGPSPVAATGVIPIPHVGW